MLSTGLEDFIVPPPIMQSAAAIVQNNGELILKFAINHQPTLP